MLSAISTNRSYGNCCDDIRPFIVSVEDTAVISSTISSATTTVSGGAETGDDITTELITVTQLNAETIVTSTLTSSSVTTTILNVSTISGFTVNSGDDVTFTGATTIDKFFWDSSKSTLFIDGDFKTRDPFITLCRESNENDPTIADVNKDKGILFHWYDDDASLAKKGFFGFDESTRRFMFNSNIVDPVTDDIVVGVGVSYGDIQANAFYAEKLINDDTTVASLGISSITDLNIRAEDNVTITAEDDLTIQTINAAGDINIATNNGDLNIDITGETTLDITNGGLDILVDGLSTDAITIENNDGVIDILTVTSTDKEAISLVTQNGGILLDSNSLGITANSTSDIDMIVTDSFNVTANSSALLSFDDTNGLVTNKEKTDYLHWVPYYKWDVSVGFWFTNRSVPSNPVHSWIKDAAAETAIIFSDLDISSRTTTDKGYKLNSIFFAYKVTGQALTSISAVLTEKTFDPTTPTAGVSLTNIPVSDGTNGLSTGTAINDHYLSVNIDTPTYLNDESVLNLELRIVSQASSVFEFYGVHLSFARNDM
jgi:hypothetical protein